MPNYPTDNILKPTLAMNNVAEHYEQQDTGMTTAPGTPGATYKSWGHKRTYPTKTLDDFAGSSDAIAFTSSISGSATLAVLFYEIANFYDAINPDRSSDKEFPGVSSDNGYYVIAEGHTFEVGECVVFTVTSGNVVEDTPYYIIEDGFDAGGFKVSKTPGGTAFEVGAALSGDVFATFPEKALKYAQEMTSLKINKLDKDALRLAHELRALAQQYKTINKTFIVDNATKYPSGKLY